jgi:class I fructose-bisphosphate aldolase
LKFKVDFLKYINKQTPFILTLQEGDSLEHIQKSFGITYPISRPLYKKIFAKADYIQAISKFLSDYAKDMGAVAVGATIYFGSPESTRQITEVSAAFAQAHELGLATILWCYMRNSSFKADGIDHHTSADLTGQANHLGATIEADIVKQKLPTQNGGFKALNMGKSAYGKLDEKMYTQLCSDHPIDLTRYQVINGFSGRIGLINSGGASGSNDLQEALATAVINKRAGGMGLISGRKAFQKPLPEGIKILNAIQDVYLCKEVTIA